MQRILQSSKMQKITETAAKVGPWVEVIVDRGATPLCLIGIVDGVLVGQVAAAADNKTPPDLLIRALQSAIEGIRNGVTGGLIRRPPG